MLTYLRVLEAVESEGVRAWLAGDSARDIVMGVCPLSLSIVAEQCDLNKMAAALGGGTVSGSEPYPMLHTSILGFKVELTCLKGGSIEDDLANRDFSMNAIAIRSDAGFIDPFNGRHDIRNDLIRITGDNIDLIKEDPIRIVRMLRFAAELDMSIFWKSESDVRTFIEESPERIKNSPSERWGREILNSMRRRPYDFIYLCDRYRLLPLFLEDVERLKDLTSKNGKNLFEHTIEVLQKVQDFLGHRKRLQNDMALSLATLFHHAGSEGNELVGTDKASGIAERYLKSWNIPSVTADGVVALIKNYRASYEPLAEEQLCRACLKFGFDVVEMIADFALCNADPEVKDIETLTANKQRLGEVLRRFDEVRRKTDGGLRYLSGDEVMQVLQIKPSKTVGEILRALDVAVGTGVVGSKKEAEEWVQQRGVAV